MDDAEVRLRILESAMKYISGSGSDGVLKICREFESYVMQDKVSIVDTPKDGEKEHRVRTRNKT